MTGFIVNPAAGGGRTGRAWPQIERMLREYFDPLTVRVTAAPGDATRLACELLQAGAERIVAVGGDGTVNEVLNSGCPCLGVLPAGSAGDFARMLDLPRDWRTAAAWLAAARPVEIDVGLATCAGETSPRRFINMASFGLGGRVARRRHLPYLLAAMAELGREEPALFYLTLDGVALSTRALHIAIGNGRYQGKGMNLCPHAQLDDGLLDVTVVEPLGWWEIARDVRMLYSGAILDHPKVRSYRARALTATADRPVALELDGEPVGLLPAEIRVEPRALRVLVKKA
jgi:YegS/Rv2252/BmrU family lipid kinase